MKPVERLSKLVVVLSMLIAGVAYGALVSQASWTIAATAAAAFVATFLLTRISLRLGLSIALVTTYVAPAALMVLFASAEYHLLLVWLALLAGPIAAAGDWSRWSFPARWTMPLAGWALVLAITWPVIAAREVDFSLVAARTFDTPNGLLAGPPPYVAAWVISVALGQMTGLLFLDLLWARFGADRLRRAERTVFAALTLSMVLSAAAAGYQKFVDIDWLNVGDWPSLGRASGLMMDANSLGTAAAMWVPMSMLLVRRLERPLLLATPVVGVLLTGVWASGSRTALLTLVVGLAGVAVVAVRRTRAQGRRRVLQAVAASTVAVLGIVALASVDDANPVARALQMFAPPDAGATESSSGRTGLMPMLRAELWERNGYGPAAGQAFSEHPWTGVGIGGFTPLSTDYAFLAKGRVIPPDNAQNWWRHQLVELGVLGALPSLAFSLVLLLAIVRTPAPAETRDAAAMLRGVLIGVGLASLLGVSTQHPALFLTFVAAAYWLGALVDIQAGTSGGRQASTITWTALLVISLGVAGGQYASARGDLRVPMRAQRVGFPYGYGFSAPAPDPQLGEARWAGKRAVGVIRVEHAYFALTLVTRDATSADPVHVQLWRGAELAAEVHPSGPTPTTRIVKVPEGHRFLMFELRTSGEADEGRVLKVAGRWLREVPPDTPPGTVVP